LDLSDEQLRRWVGEDGTTSEQTPARCKVTEASSRSLPVIECVESPINRAVLPKCEPNDLLTERRQLDCTWSIRYETEEYGSLPSTGYRTNDSLFEKLFGRVRMVDSERIREVILRMVETERLVGYPLCAGLEPNRCRLGCRLIPDDARHFQRFDRAIALDTEHADVQFASKRSRRS